MYNNTQQIVQSPGSVMILAEMIHDARIIPIVKSKAEQAWPGRHSEMGRRRRRLV